MERLYVLIHEKTKEKQEGSHRVAAEIVAGMIRGSKNWTVEMLDELWSKLTPFLREVCSNLGPETLSLWGTCFKLGIVRAPDACATRFRTIVSFHVGR